MHSLVNKAELIISEGVHPKVEMLCRLLDYWNEKRGQRQFPSRSDLDPIDFAYALGNIVLVELVGHRLRFRLDGANLAQSFDHDLTGEFVDEMEPVSFRESVDYLYRETIRRRAPIHYFRTAELTHRRLSYEAICLPLSADGQSISMIFDVMAPIKPIQPPLPLSSPINLRHNIGDRSLQLNNDLV